ncbi:hypothetical protein AC1031_015135 [Aphanomyces cochlioides]|nr:hypothetical protein AC1031_015135 [Aphanomyces cochlioides]
MKLRHLKIPFFLAVVVSLCCWTALVFTFTGSSSTSKNLRESADKYLYPIFRTELSATMRQPNNQFSAVELPSWRKNATKDDFECLGWRQTGECDPNGPREPNQDKPCDAIITAGNSGFCESRHIPTGTIVRSFVSHCIGMKAGSQFACNQTGDFMEYATLPLKYQVRQRSPPISDAQKSVDLTRGVIMAVYPKVMKSVYAAVKRLRDTGCRLPIELWYRQDEMDISSPIMASLLRQEDIFAREILQRDAVHFYVKPYALYHSAFTQVLLLDCDNFVTVDPTYLFRIPEFTEVGAMFWPDFWRMKKTIFNIHNESVLWDMLGVPFVDMMEQESGQVLVDKSKSQDALRALMFYSFHHPRLIESLDMAWGDKDLFRFAWMKSQTPFHMIQKPPGSAGVKHITYNLFCGHTMVQHDPAGRIVFFHRNTYKLTGRADAPKIWDHVQQYKKSQVDDDYDVRGANGGEVFPTFKRCFGRDTAYEELFNLTPLSEFPFGATMEESILKYAHEAFLMEPETDPPKTTATDAPQ